MEWATLQHLDLRHVGRSSKSLQPHAAAFHPTQALLAVAVGSQIIGKSFSFSALNFNMLYVLLINSVMMLSIF